MERVAIKKRATEGGTERRGIMVYRYAFKNTTQYNYRNYPKYPQMLPRKKNIYFIPYYIYLHYHYVTMFVIFDSQSCQNKLKLSELAARKRINYIFQ